MSAEDDYPNLYALSDPPMASVEGRDGQCEVMRALDEIDRLREVAGGLVVRPGDTLIVRIARIQHDHARELKRLAEEHLPGIKVVVMSGDQLAVYRPTPAVQGDDPDGGEAA